MHERKRLNKLVILTLGTTNAELKASQLYEVIKVTDPSILRDERVKGFRSFVKVINSFELVRATGSGTKKYTLGNKFK